MNTNLAIKSNHQNRQTALLRPLWLGLVLLLPGLLLTSGLAEAQARKHKPATEITTTVPMPLPVISWDAKTFDFGQLKQGEKTTTSYSFTNTGDAPLVISNVQITCGCTATEWSRRPLAPKETSKITVTFNSAGKMGRQNKIITVISNAEKIEEQLTLSGVVLPADTKTETAK